MRNWMKGAGLAACLVAAATAACAPTAQDDGAVSDEAAATSTEIANAFDVNDVSILLPMQGKTPYPQIRVSGIAAAGADTAPAAEQLWPKDTWEQVIAEARSRGIESGETGEADFFKLRGLWHIAGVRFDPCAPGFDQATLDAVPGPTKGKCIVQMRLIAQPFINGQSADFSAHLVYNLGVVAKADLASNPIVKAAVARLGQIKDASSRVPGGKTVGQPLGVHPGLDAESKGSTTEVADLLKQMIKELSNTPSRSIAFMGLQNGGPEPWTFFAGSVDSGRFVAGPGPVHGQLQQSLDFTGNGPVNPPGAARSTTPLFQASSRDDLSSEQKKLAFAVEDPHTSNFFNTDCVSCHTSSSRTHDLQLGDGAEISARVRVPKNLTGYVLKLDAQDSSWNVRNFGYFFDKPTVSGRTVSETVEVALWINKNVRVPGAGINGPARDCSAVDDAVWTCFRDGRTDCLKKCAAAPVPTAAVVTPPPSILPIDPVVSGDPCVNGTVGGAGSVEVVPFAATKSVVAQVSGNDSMCLSRLLAGAFVTSNMVMVCTGPTSCTLTIPDGATDTDTVVLRGDELTRVRQFLRLAEGTFFQSRATNGGVRIDVAADAVTIRVAKTGSELASGTGRRINP